MAKQSPTSTGKVRERKVAGTLAAALGLALIACSSSVDEQPTSPGEDSAPTSALSQEAASTTDEPFEETALASEEPIDEEEPIEKAIRDSTFVQYTPIAKATEWCCPEGKNPIDNPDSCRQLILGEFGICLRVRWSCSSSTARRCSRKFAAVGIDSFRAR